MAKTTSTTTNIEPIRIVISCHSEHRTIAENLEKIFSRGKFRTFILDQRNPKGLSARANLIRWCDVFIVLVSRSYQEAADCLETLNYAKDVSKNVVSLLVEPNFRAFGALGAIVASSIGSFVLNDVDQLADLEVPMVNSILSKTKDRKESRNVKDPSEISDNGTEFSLIQGEKRCQVLICTVSDGLNVGRLIEREFSSKNIIVDLEDLTKPSSPCSVEFCSVFVAILTENFESNPVALAAFEAARKKHKPIVPVIAVDKWRPNDALGLATAGLVFFRIFDEQTAFKPFFDSNRMTDLRVEVERSMQKIPSRAERENIEIRALKAELETIKGQLITWPPPRKNRRVDVTADRQPVRVQLETPNATHRFLHTHHTITRMDMRPPPPLLDEFGLPKRRHLDCMISYQWDDQKFVREVYEDMSMRGLRVWFDIWGAMQGNSNEAMALGIECSKVIVVFLSKAYVKSKNCLLEFRYAVKRGKAFVILRTKENIPIEPWMANAIEGFPQFDAFSYKQLEEQINNVPKIDVILQAVRKLENAQPPDPIDDCSPELLELRLLLDDARDALLVAQNKQRYKQCTRCKQDFDEFNKSGCKKHQSYYLGGSIIEGRWVCCRQQAKDSPGCQPCDHIDVPLVLKRHPSYGTWTWELA